MYRYVELEEMLSLKNKEILDKSCRLEELNAQVGNRGLMYIGNMLLVMFRSKVFCPM